MGTVNPECRKYQEQITSAVDNVLGQSEWEKLKAHLTECSDCTSELEVEKLARRIVKSQCRRVRAPSHMLNKITDQLTLNQASVSKKPWWKEKSSSPYIRAAAGLAVVASIVAAIFLNTSAAPNDVIKQSYANYKTVAHGDMKPQLVSDNTENVQNFFEGKTRFPVVVPTMKGCKLVGGAVDEVSGEYLAHVVYSHNSEVVYLYETCWETVQVGKDFHLPQDVQDELKRSGWYAASDPEGHSLVMWTKGNTLCSAVAKMNKETLLACLNTGL